MKKSVGGGGENNCGKKLKSGGELCMTERGKDNASEGGMGLK